MTVRIIEVDTCAGDTFPLDRPPYDCVVNMVSDAAPPNLSKICLTLLRGAELWGIPCVNGSAAYSLGSSKVLHHQTFARAGLNTPRSVVINGTSNGGAFDAETVLAAAETLLAQGAHFPLLVKPNAAGFGAGIMVLDSQEAIAKHFNKPKEISCDGVALVQERLIDSGVPNASINAFYRVWFLNGGVQCAVELTRRGHGVTGGCVGGLCTRPTETAVPDTFRAWVVPDCIREAVTRVAGIAQATCGSVELLFVDGKPVYFDLNMLSTLPTLDMGVQNLEVIIFIYIYL
jgi:hypothetical protein